MKRLDELYQEAFDWGPAPLACVHLVLGCYLAPRWPDCPSPPWSVIIGPQSGGKSTILSMFNGIPYTVRVDHMTRNALTSSYVNEDDPDADFALFNRLSAKTAPVGEKVWITQELSTITALDPVILEGHIANIRASHGVGTHTTQSGMSGERTRYIGAFGMLLGTTEAFEPVRARMTTFGDRFLALRMTRRADTLDEMQAKSEHAWKCNSAMQAKLKRAIQEETHNIINRGITNLSKGNGNGGAPPAIVVPPTLMENLSAWTTMHDTFATSPLSNGALATSAGQPYRIVEQVRAWGDTHAFLDERTEWNDAEMDVARRLFQDSMPRAHWDLLSSIARPGGANTTSINLIRQWASLGAVETVDGSVIAWSHDQKYRLTEGYRQLAERSGYFDG